MYRLHASGHQFLGERDVGPVNGFLCGGTGGLVALGDVGLQAFVFRLKGGGIFVGHAGYLGGSGRFRESGLIARLRLSGDFGEAVDGPRRGHLVGGFFVELADEPFAEPAPHVGVEFVAVVAELDDAFFAVGQLNGA
ncbi:hypothetical protein D3C71_1796180 [compost metagenome]